MADITVTCDCGRKMHPVGTEPKGTFACGCGARIHVAIADKATCIGLAESGSRCGFAPVREAAEFDLSLCADHYAGYLDVLEQLRLARNGELWTPPKAITEWLADLEAARGPGGPMASWARRREAYAAQSVVYYVRIRDTIKIGHTINMRARFSALVIDELLATEPGGEDLERMRHKQFAALRIRGERFEPGPELVAHIEMLRKHYGQPTMTGYLTEDGTPVTMYEDLKPQRQKTSDPGEPS